MARSQVIPARERSRALGQYMLQADGFSRAVPDRTEGGVPLEDGLQNTRLLEAVFASAPSGTRVSLP